MVLEHIACHTPGFNDVSCPCSKQPLCHMAAGCPRGKYSTGAWNSGSPQCLDCPKGSYCGGGDFELNVQTSLEACPVNMTTIGRRTESARGCGK